MTRDPAASARIGGQPATLREAVHRAAALLDASRCAVIAGLATDAAGVEAAVALARRIGGVLDHMHAEPVLRELDAMRQDGWIVTSPLQARARADLLLLAGPGIAHAWPQFAERLQLALPPALMPDRHRRVLLLGADAQTASLAGNAAKRIDLPPSELPAALGVLRALASGRRLRRTGVLADNLAGCAAALSGARYGVIVWCADGLDNLSVAQLVGLVEDLNRKTRFAGLPLAPSAHVETALQATASLTGFPLRVGFGRGHAEHDPFRFSARRMVESGEADAALWIASLGEDPPPWTRAVPTVALLHAGASLSSLPDVTIAVGAPGVDHDSVLHDIDVGTLVARAATAPSAAPSVAEIVGKISAALPC